MKKFLIFVTVLTVSIKLSAQTVLFATFNSTHSGRNISGGISKTIKDKYEFGVGVRYNINKWAHPDDQGNLYLKRLYATKVYHHFGIEAFFHHKILPNWEDVSPFIFYDLQISYSTTRNRDYLPYTYDINGDVLYKKYIEIHGPFIWLEQCIGIGFNAKLINNLYLTQKIGGGTSFIIGKDEMLLGTYDKFEWEFAGLIQVGLIYRINN